MFSEVGNIQYLPNIYVLDLHIAVLKLMRHIGQIIKNN